MNAAEPIAAESRLDAGHRVAHEMERDRRECSRT